VAVSLSNHTVKLYRPRESCLEYERDLAGHSSTISDVQYALPDAPHALHTSSADGTVLGWDTRSGKQVEKYTRQGQELWSFSAGGGSSGHLLAAGGNAEVSERQGEREQSQPCRGGGWDREVDDRKLRRSVSSYGSGAGGDVGPTNGQSGGGVGRYAHRGSHAGTLNRPSLSLFSLALLLSHSHLS
jgi:hypothetical protein